MKIKFGRDGMAQRCGASVTLAGQKIRCTKDCDHFLSCNFEATTNTRCNRYVQMGSESKRYCEKDFTHMESWRDAKEVLHKAGDFEWSAL